MPRAPFAAALPIPPNRPSDGLPSAYPLKSGAIFPGTFRPARASMVQEGCDMTMRFIPREKLGKKARRLQDRERRCEWGLSPVTRRVESKKKYSRKRKSHADETAWDFCN